MKRVLQLWRFSPSTASVACRAQVVPAAIASPSTGEMSGLPVSGTLHYSVRYSQTAAVRRRPGRPADELRIRRRELREYRQAFSVLHAVMAADMAGLGWPPSAGNVFQHLSLSQAWLGVRGTSWPATMSAILLRPNYGLLGSPRNREPIGGTGTPTPPDQTILTVNTRSIDNMTTLGFGHRLDSATTLNLSGASGQMLYIDNDGQNMDTYMASAGVTRRLSARNSFSGQYSFSRFNYVGSFQVANTAPISYSQANTVQFSLSRQWNAHLVTSASADRSGSQVRTVHHAHFHERRGERLGQRDLPIRDCQP